MAGEEQGPTCQTQTNDASKCGKLFNYWVTTPSGRIMPCGAYCAAHCANWIASLIEDLPTDIRIATRSSVPTTASGAASGAPASAPAAAAGEDDFGIDYVFFEVDRGPSTTPFEFVIQPGELWGEYLYQIKRPTGASVGASATASGAAGGRTRGAPYYCNELLRRQDKRSQELQSVPFEQALCNALEQDDAFRLNVSVLFYQRKRRRVTSFLRGLISTPERTQFTGVNGFTFATGTGKSDPWLVQNNEWRLATVDEPWHLQCASPASESGASSLAVDEYQYVAETSIDLGRQELSSLPGYAPATSYSLPLPNPIVEPVPQTPKREQGQAEPVTQPKSRGIGVAERRIDEPAITPIVAPTAVRVRPSERGELFLHPVPPQTYVVAIYP
jgi:hypothetical protein